MSRTFIALIFGFITVALAVFLWQRQIQQYRFSFEKEKQAAKFFQESVGEYKKSLPSFEIPDKVVKEFEKFRLENYGTTTPDYAESTTTEEELKAFFEGL